MSHLIAKQTQDARNGCITFRIEQFSHVRRVVVRILLLSQHWIGLLSVITQAMLLELRLFRSIHPKIGQPEAGGCMKCCC